MLYEGPLMDWPMDKQIFIRLFQFLTERFSFCNFAGMYFRLWFFSVTKCVSFIHVTGIKCDILV